MVIVGCVLVSSNNEENIFWRVFDLAPTEGHLGDDKFLRVLQWIGWSIPIAHCIHNEFGLMILLIGCHFVDHLTVKNSRNVSVASISIFVLTNKTRSNK